MKRFATTLALLLAFLPSANAATVKMVSIKPSINLVIPDDIAATVATADSAGNFWVAGAKLSEPTPVVPAPTPTALNPNNVQIDTPTVLPTLTTLVVMKYSKSGALLQQYSNLIRYVVYPNEILIKSSKLTIRGEISTGKGDGFEVGMNTSGVFTTVIPYALKVKDRDTYQLQTKLSQWKSYTTSLPIKGISWKPTKATRVLVRTDLKTKAVVAGYVMSGDLLSLSWIESVGIIIFRHEQTGYSLTILK